MVTCAVAGETPSAASGSRNRGSNAISNCSASGHAACAAAAAGSGAVASAVSRAAAAAGSRPPDPRQATRPARSTRHSQIVLRSSIPRGTVTGEGRCTPSGSGAAPPGRGSPLPCRRRWPTGRVAIVARARAAQRTGARGRRLPAVPAGAPTSRPAVAGHAGGDQDDVPLAGQSGRQCHLASAEVTGRQLRERYPVHYLRVRRDAGWRSPGAKAGADGDPVTSRVPAGAGGHRGSRSGNPA